jgi:hypothetical protein
VVQAQVVLLQQTPGQGLGVQEVPAPLKVDPPGHPFSGTVKHVHIMLSQHTPVQGTVAQALIPLNTVPAGQGGLTSVQAPEVVLQQEMRTGQQVLQLNECVGPVQLAAVVVVQRPVRTSQHLPTQGIGVHEPLQMKVLGAAHDAAVAPVEQVQSAERQQTPRHGAGVHVPLQ